jgi:replicative DNA helicase
VPIIALAQLNRAVETRQDKRPVLSDLRDSGALEQEADIVAFLYRDVYYNKETSQEPDLTELILSKHRNGRVGTIKLRFQPEHHAIRSVWRRIALSESLTREAARAHHRLRRR